jgi:hypothetical protein
VREQAVFLRAEPGAGFRLREGAPQPTSHATETFAGVFGERLSAAEDAAQPATTDAIE